VKSGLRVGVLFLLPAAPTLSMRFTELWDELQLKWLDSRRTVPRRFIMQMHIQRKVQQGVKSQSPLLDIESVTKHKVDVLAAGCKTVFYVGTKSFSAAGF
jgi:hypothetical protein